MKKHGALEATIAALVEGKNAAREGSAEYRLAIRQLTGMRYSYELGGPMIEDLDPYRGSECMPMPARPGGAPWKTMTK